MTVLVAVILVNVVVSLFGFRVLRDGAARGAESYLFIPHQVSRGENGLGMLLAHFAHGGFAHLAFNMIALYSFSGTVLTGLGPAEFLLIYAAAGVATRTWAPSVWIDLSVVIFRTRFGRSAGQTRISRLRPTDRPVVSRRTRRRHQR